MTTPARITRDWRELESRNFLCPFIAHLKGPFLFFHRGENWNKEIFRRKKKEYFKKKKSFWIVFFGK